MAGGTLVALNNSNWEPVLSRAASYIPADAPALLARVIDEMSILRATTRPPASVARHSSALPPPPKRSRFTNGPAAAVRPRTDRCV